MSKKRAAMRREARQRKREAADLVTVTLTPLESVGDLAGTVFGTVLEPLTGELIAELAARGWPQVDLEAMAIQGYQYSRRRDSIVSPVQFEDGLDGPVSAELLELTR